MPGAAAMNSSALDIGHTQNEQTYLKSIFAPPCIPITDLGSDDDEASSEAGTTEHSSIMLGRKIKPQPPARPPLGHPKSHVTFLQQFKDVPLSSPSKRQHRQGLSGDSGPATPMFPLGQKQGPRVSSRKSRSSSPENLDSSSSTNPLSRSNLSSGSSSRTSRPQPSASGLVSLSRPTSPDSSSEGLPASTLTPTRPTKPHVLTPDSTHLDPQSRQPGDATPLPVLPLSRPQSPDVEPSSAKQTGPFTPEPTLDREKSQCQGLTGEKVQCTKWKTGTEGAIYFCKPHQAQSGSPLHERVARAKEEELIRSNEPGQCQGLNRRRIQCGSAAATGSEAFKGYCSSHKNQQVPGQPEPPSLEPGTGTGANNADNCKGTSTSGPASDDENHGQMIQSHVEAARQRRRTSLTRAKPISTLKLDHNQVRHYIPPYMTGKALTALQARMDTSEKSVDEGYIYVCELTNKRTERHIYIKVGCSKGPDDRVLQWEAKCPKNIFDHRGVWPKCEAARDRLTINEEERGDPCLYKFVLEALVKIELGHLAKISGHLPDGERLDAPKPERCACGVKHREIYAIARYGVKDRGDNDKKLWEMIDGVVQRWTWFVALYHKTPRRLSVPL